MKTGEWVRQTARGEAVVITERGRPVASLIPFREGDVGRSFRDRLVLPEFEALPVVDGDSTEYVSEDRDRSMIYFDTAYILKCCVKEHGWEQVRDFAGGRRSCGQAAR